MSIKIYQMQKEMEAIDRKYEKEIQMYKDAFEREKDQKSQMGDWEALSSENDSLKLEIDELDLKIEEMESIHSAEINMYKQKLGDEKMLNLEELRLKVKSLEDVIEGQKLEHEKELEDLKQQRDASVQELERRYENELECLKNEQKVLNGASSKSAMVSSLDLQQRDKKIKDLEFRIEELETLLEVKRRRHKEEIKNLRQRLEDELTKHSEDVRSHRTRVRMLERRKSEHSISFGLNMDDDYKRMYEEQRSENIKLKFTNEKQKKELEELRAKMEETTEALKAAKAKEAEAKEDKPEKPDKPPKPAQLLERRTPRGKLGFWIFLRSIYYFTNVSCVSQSCAKTNFFVNWAKISKGGVEEELFESILTFQGLRALVKRLSMTFTPNGKRRSEIGGFAKDGRTLLDINSFLSC